MNKVVDQDVRDEVLQAQDSFIIQAPAGSGKTGLLIQRYLTLLALVDEPEEIIAITFTRKAAAEMQGRILKSLKQAAQNSQAPDVHEKTLALAHAALARDKLRGWNIIDSPARLRIQTIDSLCASLSRQMPLLARLGTQPETVDDASLLYEQAAIKTLAELENGSVWSEAIASLLIHLDNDLPRVKRLIIDMLAKRDQWLPYVSQQHDRDDMQDALRNLIEEKLEQTCKLIPDDILVELIDLLHYAGERLVETDPENVIAKNRELDHLPTASIDYLDIWKAFASMLLTQAGEWRKQLTIKNGFPPAGTNKLEADDRRQRKQHMQDVINRLRDIQDLQQSLDTIFILPDASYSNSDWQIIQAVCELLKLAAAQLQLVFADRNQMDFIGIAEAAIRALGNDDIPTDLALRLDYVIKHILVDEYQDISIGQYRLLTNLTREWSLDDGHSVFLVGDPMQSIYRFREADVGLFIQTFQSQRLANVPLKAKRLEVNFRSEKAIVDWINQSFVSILPGEDDMTSGAVAFNPAVAFDSTSGKENVVVYPAYSKNADIEADKVVELIESIRQTEPNESIAILVRSRTHLFQIVPKLRQANIDMIAVDIERLKDSQAIQDLLALTRAYLNLSDRIAWLACLHAPWCGLTMQSLYILCHDSRDALIWERLHQDKLLTKLDSMQQSRLKRFRDVMQGMLSQRQRYSLRLTIESLWCQLGGPATVRESNCLQDCSEYFALLSEVEQGGTLENIETLLDKLDQLFAKPKSASLNPVQLMTMHKAKGLEFDHVILPGLGRKPRNNQAGLLSWITRNKKNNQPELILAPIRAAGEKQAPLYDYLNKLDIDKQSYEDSRLLYVATTRTRKRLHLFGHALQKENKDEQLLYADSRSLLAQLWPVVSNVFEQHKPASLAMDDAEIGLHVIQESERLVSNWQLPALNQVLMNTLPEEVDIQEEEQEAIEYEWASESIRQAGSLVHAIIQQIAEEGIEQWNEARVHSLEQMIKVTLRQYGISENELTFTMDIVQRAIKNLINDQRGQWILANTHKDARNEFAISGMIEGVLTNVILDRTFIDDNGVRWIIDYKTSRHEGADVEAFLNVQQERYQSQLEKYALLFKKIEQRPTKLALYFPLLKGWREWEYVNQD